MTRATKWLAMAVVGVGLAGSAASAQVPVLGPPARTVFVPPRPCPPPVQIDYDYVVYVRHFGHWHAYGRYETLGQARRVERALERAGHRVRVETVATYGRRF